MTRLRGLYAITSGSLGHSRELLLGRVAEAIAGGAIAIQYRDKDREPSPRKANAAALADLCRARGVPLIINDDPSLAADIGADGVHIGGSDASLVEARRIVGDRAIVGVTCSNSTERALAAADAGASYIAIGRFFASRTKPDAPAAGIELLRAVRARVRVPICVIGGIKPAHVDDLVEAGADLVAAIDGVFGAADVRVAAAAYAARFS